MKRYKPHQGVKEKTQDFIESMMNPSDDHREKKAKIHGWNNPLSMDRICGQINPPPTFRLLKNKLSLKQKITNVDPPSTQKLVSRCVLYAIQYYAAHQFARGNALKS